MFKSAKEKVRKSVYIPIEISQAVERRATEGDYASFSAVVARILLKELAVDIEAFNAKQLSAATEKKGQTV